MLLEGALRPVAADLSELGQRLSAYLPTETRSARAVIDHVFGAGGKRIRPALYFMACRLLKYQGDHYYAIAAVTEFVHTASLLHDDVVDNSSLRRGKPTANSLYGDQTSVLVGDLIYSTASEMMAATGNMEIVKTFARAIRLMSDGELLQLENVFNADISLDTYLRILAYKTAVLLEAACKSAGLLANATTEEIAALSRFGYGVGMAFQLIDDALDFTGSETTFGKMSMADLKEGKVTMPLILLRDRATAAEMTRVRTILASTVGSAGAEEVAALVDKYETAAHTVEYAHSYTMQAMEALGSFAPGPERDVLENLANKLLFRFN